MDRGGYPRRRFVLLDSDSGKERFRAAADKEAVWALAFSPDGKTIASGGDKGAVRLWNADSGEAVCTLEGHTGRVRRPCLLP